MVGKYILVSIVYLGTNIPFLEGVVVLINFLYRGSRWACSHPRQVSNH